MAAQNKDGAQREQQGAPTKDQTPSVEAKSAAELEELKAQNARLLKEVEAARTAAKQAEEDAQAAREEVTAAKALLNEMDAKAEAETARQEALITRQINEQRRVRIVIPSGRDPSERAPVPVAVNGREFLICRDKEVDVPQAVLNVLDLAKEQVAEMQEVNGQAHVTFRQANRFSYQVKGFIDPKTGQLVGQ